MLKESLLTGGAKSVQAYLGMAVPVRQIESADSCRVRLESSAEPLPLSPAVTGQSLPTVFEVEHVDVDVPFCQRRAHHTRGP